MLGVAIIRDPAATAYRTAGFRTPDMPLPLDQRPAGGAP